MSWCDEERKAKFLATPLSLFQILRVSDNN